MVWEGGKGVFSLFSADLAVFIFWAILNSSESPLQASEPEIADCNLLLFSVSPVVQIVLKQSMQEQFTTQTHGLLAKITALEAKQLAAATAAP